MKMSSSIKGLLIKDFNLLKGQKNFFLGILVLWAIVGACNFDPIFLVAYVMMMFSFLFSMIEFSFILFYFLNHNSAVVIDRYCVLTLIYTDDCSPWPLKIKFFQPFFCSTASTRLVHNRWLFS